MDDVVPPKKRSIRNVPMPDGRKKTKRSSGTQSGGAQERDNGHAKESTAGRSSGKSGGGAKNTQGSQRTPQRRNGVARWGIWTVAIISVVVGVFALSTLFTSATLTVAPRTESRSVSMEITAQQTAETDALAYEQLTVQASASRDVTATGTVKVSERARGTIVIRNESDETLPLVSDTRFRARSNELIYKTPRRVRVPAGSPAEPGTVRVKVRAADTGEQYNVAAGEQFRVPGLQGDPLYDSVSAEAATAISGGAEGVQKMVAENVRERVAQQLDGMVRDRLQQKIAGQVPDTFTHLSGATAFRIEPPTQEVNGTSSSQATFSRSGTATALLFDADQLSAMLIDRAFTEDHDPDRIMIPNLEQLSFESSSELRAGNLPSSVTGTVSGRAQFVWRIDKDAIKQDLAGTSKEKLGTILEGYTEVQSARASIRPFWLTSFPGDESDIVVRVENQATSTSSNR